MKHTPGPWIFEEVRGSDDKTLVYRRILNVGNVYKQKGIASTGIDEEAEANARLIAAAPELLEACKAVANDTSHAIMGKLQAQLRIVIAKAEGKI